MRILIMQPAVFIDVDSRIPISWHSSGTHLVIVVILQLSATPQMTLENDKAYQNYVDRHTQKYVNREPYKAHFGRIDSMMLGLPIAKVLKVAKISKVAIAILGSQIVERILAIVEVSIFECILVCCIVVRPVSIWSGKKVRKSVS